jgi:rubrerythrin
MFRQATNNKGTTGLKNILGKILNVEYSLIVNYPLLAHMIQDKETQNMVNELGNASIKHYNVVSEALNKLGGDIILTLENLPDNEDLKQIFRRQLEKEKFALDMHQQCANLAQDRSLKNELTAIADEEKTHIKAVERILAKLKEGAAEKELSLTAG